MRLSYNAYYDDAGVWVSVCPQLNIYSQGESKLEAMAAIYEAVGMHIDYEIRKKKCQLNQKLNMV